MGGAERLHDGRESVRELQKLCSGCLGRARVVVAVASSAGSRLDNRIMSVVNGLKILGRRLQVISWNLASRQEIVLGRRSTKDQ